VFSDIAPGQYTVLARTTLRESGSQIFWAATELSIDGDTASGLSLVLSPGMTVSGQLRFDGAASPPKNLRIVAIDLRPIQSGDPVSTTPESATVKPDGRFTIAGVTPGRYRLVPRFSDAAANRWFARSAIVNGIDALDTPLVIQPNQNVTNVLLTFTDRSAQLTGRLMNASGRAASEYFIIVFPEDPTLWLPQARRIQSARPSADGTFVFNNLPSGTYRMAALEDAEPGEWFDPAFLRQLLGTSMAVSISEGENRVQDLRVMNVR
jgi:hypothetical protein